MYNFPLFTLCLIDSLSLVRHTCMTDLSELEVEREISLDASHPYLTVIFCFKALFGFILAQIGLVTSILNSNFLFLSSVWFYYCSYWFVTSKLDLFHHTLTTVTSISWGVSFYYIIDLFTYIDSSFSVS